MAKNFDPGRIRTCNPLIRSQMPYPLGHRATVPRLSELRDGTPCKGLFPPDTACPCSKWVGVHLAKKAPARFELAISCLLDRRFNQLSHGAGVLGTCGNICAGLSFKLCHPFTGRGHAIYQRAVSVVVITSALHAEGRQFEPGTAQFLLLPRTGPGFVEPQPDCQVGRVV